MAQPGWVHFAIGAGATSKPLLSHPQPLHQPSHSTHTHPQKLRHRRQRRERRHRPSSLSSSLSSSLAAASSSTACAAHLSCCLPPHVKPTHTHMHPRAHTHTHSPDPTVRCLSMFACMLCIFGYRYVRIRVPSTTDPHILTSVPKHIHIKPSLPFALAH